MTQTLRLLKNRNILARAYRPTWTFIALGLPSHLLFAKIAEIETFFEERYPEADMVRGTLLMFRRQDDAVAFRLRHDELPVR